MVRCCGNTANGDRCKRYVSTGKFCWQHRVDVKSVATDTSKTIINNITPRLVKSKNTNGTRSLGTVIISYNKLVKKLGKPHHTNVEKTLALWNLEDDKSGMVFTIYDWKNYGSKKENIGMWHIGGHDDTDVNILSQYLGKKVKMDPFVQKIREMRRKNK